MWYQSNYTCFIDLTHTQKPVPNLKQNNAPNVLVRFSYYLSVVNLKFGPNLACT